MHLGHQALMAAARDYAHARGLPALAMTFEPHPTQVLYPDQPWLRLSDSAAREHALRSAGADQVHVVPATAEWLRMPAEDFLRNLVQDHQPAAIVEGVDFRFGHGRQGDVALLHRLGAELGFETIIVPPVQMVLDDLTMTRVSTSLVRWLLERGRVRDVQRGLGRAYVLSGQVIKGEQRGRTLGFPTANLDPQAIAGRVLPADGVYAGQVELPNGWIRPAALSVGIKPTFAGHQLAIEAHLLGFEGDLYGQDIHVRFLRWLRAQRPFPGVDALKMQLSRDVAETLRLDRAGYLGTVNQAELKPVPRGDPA
ncbi:MAG: riboflavin biosynthesis protein RibF [Phycisphaeraceae bacterium]|nr:riboflavin biosynthesis protein RibF [Phycisphaeraceae bacterium]